MTPDVVEKELTRLMQEDIAPKHEALHVFADTGEPNVILQSSCGNTLLQDGHSWASCTSKKHANTRVSPRTFNTHRNSEGRIFMVSRMSQMDGLIDPSRE